MAEAKKWGSLTDFIRSCPASMTIPEVRAEGAKCGLVLSRSIVSVVRRSAVIKRANVGGRKSPSAEEALRRAVKVIGVAQARRLIREIELDAAPLATPYRLRRRDG